MPSIDHSFAGQFCWVCEQPIFGTGIFDAPPDGVGVTSYHEKCWAVSHIYQQLPEACLVIRVDNSRVIEKGHGEALIEDANGKKWCLPLEYIDDHWICESLRAEIFHFAGQVFLVAKIEDQDGSRNTD